MSALTVTLTRTFNASRERVFEAFTKADALMSWFGPKGLSVPTATLDVRVGGRYRIEMHGDEGVYVLSGEYREVIPPERLVFTWVWAQGDMAGVETLVSITLAAKGALTELTLVHSGLPSAAMQDAHNQGWNSSWTCLDDMLAGKPKVPVVKGDIKSTGA
jgi:uncharacterized protein YndB with AHSA1/START domain